MNTFLFILLNMDTEAKSLPVSPFLHLNLQLCETQLNLHG
jgi:hypothetical protein